MTEPTEREIRTLARAKRISEAEAEQMIRDGIQRTMDKVLLPVPEPDGK